jgi:ankyrin repeat protein
LHYAAKAGFVKTIEVLLDHGADPIARDDNGLTAFDWLERAAPSVNRQAVRSLLQRRIARAG